MAGADYDGRTALHLAAVFGNANMIAMILEYVTEIDALDESGKTALAYAAYQGDSEVVHALLRGAPGAVSRKQRCAGALGEGLEGAPGRARAAEAPALRRAKRQKQQKSSFLREPTVKVAGRPDWLEAATRHRRRPAQLVLGGVDTDSGAVFGGPAAHQS